MELERTRGVPTKIVLPIIDPDGDPVNNPGGLEARIFTWEDAVDPTAPVPTANAPVVHDAERGLVLLTLTAAEMEHDYLYGFIESTTPNAKTQHFLIRTKTDKAGFGLSQDERNAIASTVLLRDWNLITDAVPDRCALQALRFLRNRWVAAAGLLTIFKEDDTTAAWTAILTQVPGAGPAQEVDPN